MKKVIFASVIALCGFSALSATTYSLEQLSQISEKGKTPNTLAYKEILEIKNINSFEACTDWLDEQLHPYADFPQRVEVDKSPKQYGVRVFTEDKTLTFNCVNYGGMDGISGAISEALYQ
ncbi:hypothetical protein [Providencia sp. PROV197]|uniref:hypothetical protein n=1 Tax=Providencia sp. PROV197 TaxID=2949898 RepID=UPI00234A3090|nr:hypothetical protein [Providencia sp. PROV197]